MAACGWQRKCQGGVVVGRLKRQDSTRSVGLGRSSDGVDEALLLSVLSDVRNGDFSVRIPLEWTGIAGKIADALNDVIAANQTLEAELVRVSRVVGAEGRLSRRVESRGSDRVWSQAIESVNSLIDDLVRPTTEMQRVVGAVAEGDLSRKITTDVQGEFLQLKNTVNAMVRNLRETTRRNSEQDWLKTNLERFSRMLQGQRDLATVSSMILSELAPLVSAQHGVFYTLASLEETVEPVLVLQAGYGCRERENLAQHFRIGEGLIGQAAQEKRRILLSEVPSDYVTISSGLGASAPLNIIILPIVFEGSVRAVVELASLSEFSLTHQAFLDQLIEMIGLVLNTIEANTRTENLLKQSLSQARELQARQEQLSSSNQDLAKQAKRLAEQNSEVERKSEEIVLAKRLAEEKAEQLAISSRYKSEFFSNMSHELRTPLNSLLILAGELEDNREQTLTPTQVQYASVIRSSGTDLLRLLDDLLDLAKVESGTATLEIGELPLLELREAIERDFGHVAEHQGLSFSVELSPELPPSIGTDAGRLRQVLKNLLSNAFKFTEQGEVNVTVSLARSGWSAGYRQLDRAEAVIAFAISDTGIGIPAEQQQLIFKAFAQGDGTTARQYGGTGLGLSISRELVRLLGGEITLTSAPEGGSTFILYLPQVSEGASDASPPAPVQGPALRSPRCGELVMSASAEGGATDGRSSVALARRPASSSSASVASGDACGLAGSAQTREPAPSPAEELLATTSLAGSRVLVVDDDFRNIFALSSLLKRAELDVVSAENGVQAVAVLKETSDVDLVLVDIMMPGMDGYASMRAMRELPGRGEIPLVAFTAKAEDGERQRCIEAGASAYIAKPVDTSKLLLVLGDWLTGAPRRRRVTDEVV